MCVDLGDFDVDFMESFVYFVVEDDGSEGKEWYDFYCCESQVWFDGEEQVVEEDYDEDISDQCYDVRCEYFCEVFYVVG